nr:right-handed parallel beta-helix repeat-containing protein [Salinispora mooreana]
MTNPHHDPEPDHPGTRPCPVRDPGRRTRSRWWSAGLAGMTGLALTTTVGIAAAPAAEAVGPAPSPADRQHDDGKSNSKGKKEKTPEGTPVPCDADALIAAITLANARGGATLNLATDCTYLLTTDIAGAGLPAITTPITLNGHTHTTIERAAAADPFRILTVNTGGDLTLNKIKITGGQLDGDGGGILVNPGGQLTAKHSEIVRNIAGDNLGGGISNRGTTTIKDSTVSHNTAALEGGGINNAGLLTIKGSTITHNTAAVLGGGLVSRNGTVDISESTIAANQAETGGLILIGGTSTVTDTHITKNTASLVGGVGVSAGQHTLRRVTVDHNTATADGGGVFVDVGTPLVVEDSIIANNTSDSNGGGIENVGETVLRRTKIVNNRAGNNGGGILNQTFGTLTLYATKVVKNTAANNGGGIFNQGVVELNTATGTVVIKNRPNNCVDVPGCAG